MATLLKDPTVVAWINAFDAEYAKAIADLQRERPEAFIAPPPDAIDYPMWVDWFTVEIDAVARERALVALGRPLEA